MTQSSTPVEPTFAAGSNISEIRMNFIVAFLAPTFLAAAGGNIDRARMAAIETVNAYRTRNYADLIAVAQIIAFGLATLASLSQSMADTISLSMALRLRTNAAPLSRAADRNRRTLPQAPATEPLPRQADAATEPEGAPAVESISKADLNYAETDAITASAIALAKQAHTELKTQATQAPSAMTAEKRHQAMLAIAMVKESEEITASIPNLPPSERRAASIRAAALSSNANELLTGASALSPRRHDTSGPPGPT